MSTMRDLLEKMSFAGQAVGQQPGDQVRGSEPMPRKGGGKKHPYAGRLVGGGAAESVEEDLEESLRRQFMEYGAQGSAIGNDTGITNADRVAMAQQKNAGNAEIKNQIAGLVAQITGARAQLSGLNRSFPQGANPVEKSMALKDIQSQKMGIQSQIEDLSAQLSALRTRAL